MLEFIKKGPVPFLTKRHRWFSDKPRSFFHYNTTYHWENFNSFLFGYKKIVYHTMIIELDKFDPESLLNSFSQKHRSKIRKAEGAGVTITVGDTIKNFVEFHNKFARVRNLPELITSDIEDIGMENLLVTKAVYNKKEIVYMLYLFDEKSKRVLSWYTAYIVWEEMNEETEKVISWTNRYLLYHGMVLFMKKGYKIFDLCGYNNGAEDDLKWKGISNFKDGFHGIPVDVYKYFPIPKIIYHKIKDKIKSRS